MGKPWNSSIEIGVTAYMPFTPSHSGKRLHPLSYRGCWHRVSRYLSPSGGRWALELYDSSAFFAHGVWLDQACAHCQILSTAAALSVWPVSQCHRGRSPSQDG